MTVLNKNWRLPWMVIGFIGGMLLFQLLLVHQPIESKSREDGDGKTNWQQDTNCISSVNSNIRSNSSSNNSKSSKSSSSSNTVISLPDTKESSLIMTQRLNIVPSLQEDWGELECPLKFLSSNKQELYDYLTTITLPCEKQVMVGGTFRMNKNTQKYFFDGEKYLCLDDSFDFNYGSCTSLSFGISTDWSYDDEMDEVFGCKVYAFDPTIGLQDHNRSKNIKFFNLGISDGPGRMKGGKLESYSEILKKLNLENTTIDYLKMDVEGSEWKFLKDVLMKTPNLLKNVRQMGMEIHFGANFASAWNYFQRLHCLGFRIMFSHYNPVEKKWKVKGKRRANLYEIVWGQDRIW